MRSKNRLRTFEKTNPWYKFYNNMKTRCKPNNEYGKRGIKVFISIEDIKYIWIRDKAYLMENPSLDRINGLGNYSMENIQFIEYKENVRKRHLFHPYKWDKHGACRVCKRNDREYEAFGLCGTCYSYLYRYNRKKFTLFKEKYGEKHYPPIRTQLRQTIKSHYKIEEGV